MPTSSYSRPHGKIYPRSRNRVVQQETFGSGQTLVVGMQAVEHICRLGIGVRLTQSAVTELGHTALFPQRDESQHRDGNYRRGRDCRTLPRTAKQVRFDISFSFTRITSLRI